MSHEKKPRISKRVSGLPVIGLLTVVYFIAGKFGLMLASLHASASPVWPAAGIALGALLVLGYRAWPAIFVGALLVNVSTAGNVATSLAIASGNTLEAVCGAWLVNRFAGGTTVFDRPQGVFKFALAAAVSTIISPAFGVTSLAFAGFADWTNYAAIWLTWWLGDTTGDLLIAPLIILWGIASKRRWNRREAVEAGIVLLLLFVLSEAVFCGWLTISPRNYPLPFVIFGPIVIWTAFRLAQRETATGIFILSAFAIWGTLHGFGPFVREMENQSLLALQSWTAVLTITAMALSAAMAERRRAEEALRESEARINLAANAANLGLWVWNLRDEELWVTEKWKKLFGFAESEPVTVGQLAQRVHPEDRERMKQRVQHMLEYGGVDRESEYRITQPDGSTRWIAGYGGVELDEHGKPACARGVSRDITERKIAEEELRETQQRMELVANSAELGMWMWDIVRNEIWITDKGRALFGFAPSEKVDFDRFRSVLHPEDRESVLEAVENSLRTGAEYESEYRVTLPNGQIRWMAGRGHVEFNADAQPARMLGVSLDVTKRKEAEEQFRLVVESAPNAMIMLNAKGRITLVNTQTETVFGYAREELIGHLIEMLVPEGFVSHHMDYGPGYFSAARARPIGARQELLGRRKDGSEVPVEIGLNPIRTSEGLFVLASIIDISERKQAELQAQEHRDEVEELRRQKTALLEKEVAERARLEREVIESCAREQRRIAYDLHDGVGQELLGIALSAKLLEQELRTARPLEADKASAIVRLASEAARHARLTARTLEGADGVGDLKTALEALARNIRDHCHVESTVRADASSCPVSAPVSAQLYRIAQEALRNAVEHGAARQVWIDLGFNHENMVLTVRDNGKGFDANSGSDGMGLRIMQYRAQCIGGSCEVQSNSAIGTVVTCRVPLQADAEAPPIQ